MDVPLPKNPYGNVKMEVYFDIIDLVGNYIVINELKSPYENKSF
jgi:sporulation protein YlmC with PRC-barrel domain